MWKWWALSIHVDAQDGFFLLRVKPRRRDGLTDVEVGDDAPEEDGVEDLLFSEIEDLVAIEVFDIERHRASDPRMSSRLTLFGLRVAIFVSDESSSMCSVNLEATILNFGWRICAWWFQLIWAGASENGRDVTASSCI